ncbi:MAG: hypothetical protein IID45_06380 [Planctomycetes bacterium]|nr:hypothetical protein [Planctomycetota bacterium]
MPPLYRMLRTGSLRRPVAALLLLFSAVLPVGCSEKSESKTESKTVGRTKPLSSVKPTFSRENTIDLIEKKLQGKISFEEQEKTISILAVDLAGTEVSDDDLEHLVLLTEVRFLSLADTSISDAGLQHLEQLSELNQLDLSKSRVTKEGVKSLQRALPLCVILN